MRLAFAALFLVACGRIAFEERPENIPIGPGDAGDAGDAGMDAGDAGDAGMDAGDAAFGDADVGDAEIPDTSDADMDASDAPAMDAPVDAPMDVALDAPEMDVPDAPMDVPEMDVPDGAPVPCLPWEPGAVFVSQPLDTLNTGSTEDKPRLARDGLTLYFDSNRPGGSGGFDIFEARRASRDEPFALVGAVELASSVSYDDCLVIRADGLEAWIASNRAGTMTGGTDLWVATRESTEDAFSPFVAAPFLNSPDDENDPFITADGLHLYFVSERFETPVDHLAVASRDTLEDAFENPAELTELSPPGVNRGNPTLTDDELLIVFNTVEGGASKAVFATRSAPEDTFGTPEDVPGAPASLTSPMISGDGCELFYTVTRDIYRAVYTAP